MGEQTKNMLIGMFVVAACFLIVSLVLFLKPGVGDGRQKIYVRFSNINKINVGTRVMFAGKPVGEVVEIDEINDARKMLSTDLLGRIYCYQLLLKVDSHIKVYDTDEVSIQTSGLLGEKSIAIMPKTPPKGVTPTLITTQPIYAESTDLIENAFLELSDLASDLQVTIKEVNRWLQKNGEDLGNAVRSFGGAMEEIKGASHSIEQIAQGVIQGKGTMGRLFEGDELYLRMTAVMSKLDTLMNDVNHYGILFHLNKSWQRQRLQRVTALSAFDTPQSFKQYFETEVEQINIAMSRLSLLIEKAEVSPEKEQIFKEVQFKKEFAEFLREVNELSDQLRLYNQELMKDR